MLSEKLQLKLPSLPENIHQVEKFVEDICEEFNINNTYFGNILLVLTEAVENGMKHGNNNDPSKYVQIFFSSNSEGLSFIIKDEGKGFDISHISDLADLKSNLEESNSRGIFLMKSLADEIKFLDAGSKLEIIFKISSINNDIAIDRINQLKKYKEGEGTTEKISSHKKHNKRSS